MTGAPDRRPGLSRPHQTSREAPASRLVAAIEAVWAEIRRRHPDVPDVVVTVGAGSIGAPRGTLRLGHYAEARWHPTSKRPAVTAAGAARGSHAARALAELFVAGEGLAHGAVDVLGTLLPWRRGCIQTFRMAVVLRVMA